MFNLGNPKLNSAWMSHGMLSSAYCANNLFILKNKIIKCNFFFVYELFECVRGKTNQVLSVLFVHTKLITLLHGDGIENTGSCFLNKYNIRKGNLAGSSSHGFIKYF